MRISRSYSIDELVLKNRSTTADFHVVAGRSWRIIGEEQKLHSPLAYSAFEFRCAIERYLFELLWLVFGGNLTRKQEKAAANVANLIRELVRREGGSNPTKRFEVFERKQLFSRIFSKGIGMPRHDWPGVVDLKQLERHWTKLSEFCHRQLKPKKTWEAMGDAWVQKGYVLLNEVESYLWKMMVDAGVGWVNTGSLPSEMVQARNDFISGKIDEDDLLTRMDLMAPILKRRENIDRLFLKL